MLKWFRKVETPSTTVSGWPDDKFYARRTEIEESIIGKFGSKRNFVLAFIRGFPLTKDEEWYAENWVILNAAIAYGVGEILNVLKEGNGDHNAGPRK